MTGHRDQWFGGRTYAQHGDDLAVLNIFKRLGIEKPSYLDVGAYHPFDLSNTALLYERGSRGVNVEPNEAQHALFAKHRPDDKNLCMAVAPESGRYSFYHTDTDPGRFTLDAATAMTLSIVRRVQVPALTLTSLIECYADGVWPDLLSIDVEGLDVDVLREADFGENGGPRVVIVEADCGGGDTSHELAALMAVKGFIPHSWCGNNLIFVRAADQALVWGV